MPKYDLEIAEISKSSICPCCGQESNIGHGFIYKDDDAYAVYFSGWTKAHQERSVSLAIAIGEWGDDTTNEQRVSFGVEAVKTSDGVDYRAIEPADSPWSNTDLFGKMISRTSATYHVSMNEVVTLAEQIVCADDAIRQYFGKASLE